MPKIILNLRENILKESKNILKTESYEKLTVRRVAAKCGVAVGTVYNYFPSKEMLTAGVMLEDWNRILERMKASAELAASPMEGLEQIYAALQDYISEYSETWDQYRAHGVDRAQSPYRHRVLVEQIGRVIKGLLQRFDDVFYDGLPVFLAENLLIQASNKEKDLSPVRPIFEKIMKN